MTGSFQHNIYTLRSGLTVYPEHYKLIDRLLSDAVQKIPARFVILTDVSGQLIAARGDQGKTNLVALASLMAGDLAASQEIARLTDEYQDYQLILREGRTSHTFITEAGRHLALLVQVSAEVPLGWARLIIQQTAQQLAEVLIQEITPAVSAAPEPLLAEEDLPDLFNNALDNLWLE